LVAKSSVGTSSTVELTARRPCAETAVEVKGLAGNESFAHAKSVREDEFYTQLRDIEREMRHYREHFKGATVFCNCDDPFESEFFKYFVLNFKRLGLKQLLATCYAGSPIAGTQLSLFDVVPEASPNTPYKAVVNDVYDITGDGGVSVKANYG